MKHQNNTAVGNVRLGRKRFSISGNTLPLLLLCFVITVTQTSALPQSQAALKKSDASFNDDSVAELAFDVGAEYADVDNVEWHHVKVIDGIMHEDHPIIMYKEDFVSEDFDPSKTNASGEKQQQAHQRRKYNKNMKRQNRLKPNEFVAAAAMEKYLALKPEKIYFDVLPQSPVVLTDDSSSSNEAKLDAATRLKNVEVISLLDEQSNEAKKSPEQERKVEATIEKQSSSKQLHQHLRLRRDLAAATAINDDSNDVNGHVVHKRTPHYTYERQGPNSFDDYAKHWMKKHPVAGNHWNGIDGEVPPVIEFPNRFGGEDNTDRVVWGVGRKQNRPNSLPQATKRPAQQPNFPPLFHNSNPEDADFSAFTTRRPSNQINNNSNNFNSRPATKRPAKQPQFPPLFHNSNPEDADFSAFTRPPATRTTTTTRPPTTPAASSSFSSSTVEEPISKCVWAIVNCCSTRNSEIRYNCFERLGCYGAFWDLNPCADNIKDAAIDFVDKQMQ